MRRRAAIFIVFGRERAAMRLRGTDLGVFSSTVCDYVWYVYNTMHFYFYFFLFSYFLGHFMCLFIKLCIEPLMMPSHFGGFIFLCDFYFYRFRIIIIIIIFYKYRYHKAYFY